MPHRGEQNVDKVIVFLFVLAIMLAAPIIASLWLTFFELLRSCS